MPSTIRTLALSLVLCVVGTTSRAADILQAIPDTALAVVLVNRLEESSDKVEKLAGMVHAPQQSLLTMLRVQTGIHEGLDEKGTAALVVLPAKDAGAMPQAALLVPVTDYKKFLTQLQPDDASKKFAEVRLAGHPMLVCQQGDYAVLAAPAAKGILEDVLNSVKDISGELTPLRTWLGEVDAAAVGTSAGIKFAVEQAQLFLPLIRAGAGGAGQQPGQQISVTELLNLLEIALNSIGTEVTHLALGVKADENSNLRVAARVRFAAGGNWSNAGKGVKAPKEGLLAGLPAGPFGMAYGTVVPQGLREFAGSQIAEFMKVNPALAQLPADQQAALARTAIEMMAPVDSIAMTLGIPKQGDPLYANVVMVLKVDDAPKYLDQYSAAISLFNTTFKNPQAPSIAYDVQKIDIDGTPALDVVTDLSNFNQPGAVDIKPMFAKLFGAGDKMHTYLAAVDDKTAVMAYVGLENAKRAVAAAKAPATGLAADPQIAETAALLPKGAQWTNFIHPQGILTWSEEILAMTPGLGKPQLPDAPTSPPVGLAAKISATGLNIDIVAPAATLQAIGEFVAKMRGQ